MTAGSCGNVRILQKNFKHYRIYLSITNPDCVYTQIQQRQFERTKYQLKFKGQIVDLPPEQGDYHQKTDKKEEIFQNIIGPLPSNSSWREPVCMVAVKTMKSIRKSRCCSIDSSIWEPLKLDIKKRREMRQTAKSSWKSKVTTPYSGRWHISSRHPEPKIGWIIGIRRRGTFRPLSRWASGNINPRIRFRSRVRLWIPSPIKRNQFLLLYDGLANWAFMGMRVEVQPLVQTRPTIEMTTKSYNRVSS